MGQQERHLRKSKDKMMKMLEQSYDKAEEKRRKLMDSITDQGKQLSSMIKTRGNMLACVQNVTTNITSVLQTDLADDVDKCEKEGEIKIEGFEGEEVQKKLTETTEDEKTMEVENNGDKEEKISPVSHEEVQVEQIKVTESTKKYAMLEDDVVVKTEDDISREERTEFDEARSVLSAGRITAE